MIPKLYTIGEIAYTKNFLVTCVTLATILDKPRSIGDRRRIRVSSTNVSYCSPTNPGYNICESVGTKNHKSTLAPIIKTVNTVVISERNRRASSRSVSIFFVKNGISTKRDTNDAMDANTTSGMRNEA